MNIEQHSSDRPELMEYFDQLLEEELPPRGTSTLRVLLVSVGGVQCALPSADLCCIERAGAAVPPLRVIDVATMLLGGEAKSAECTVALARDPECVLAVDEIGECVDVDEAEVRRRTRTDTKPWLVGFIDSLGAALLDVDALSSSRSLPSY